jgi:putative Mn2+ efflux pump MntP
MDFMFFLLAFLLGLSMSIDALSVSIADGLSYPSMKKRNMVGISLTFGIFQFGMPVIGYFLVKAIKDKFEGFEKAIPFIAFGLLLVLGSKMIYESFKKEDLEKVKLSFLELMFQGVATSIDALSLGFTMQNLDTLSAFVESIIIGITTFTLCIFGLLFSNILSKKIKNASLIGGIILICIGITILIRGLI